MNLTITKLKATGMTYQKILEHVEALVDEGIDIPYHQQLIITRLYVESLVEAERWADLTVVYDITQLPPGADEAAANTHWNWDYLKPSFRMLAPYAGDDAWDERGVRLFHDELYDSVGSEALSRKFGKEDHRLVIEKYCDAVLDAAEPWEQRYSSVENTMQRVPSLRQFPPKKRHTRGNTRA